MASDDDAGRLAVTLMQSLRDVGTTVPHLVVVLMRGGIGSADCHDHEWKRRRGRGSVNCNSENTIETEIVGEMYLERLAALGVETIVMDPIPKTEWTDKIPGGTQSFWGEKSHLDRLACLNADRAVAVPLRLLQAWPSTS